MRYSVLSVAGLMALMGCDDGSVVEPRKLGPYEVTALRTLPEGVEASFVDLNENGQALWHEGEQTVLWDQGSLLEVPAGKILGSSGELLGDSSVWIDGEVTDLPGLTRGITEDGTVYLSRNDTMFTWRDGILQDTPLPLGLVGPDGLVWNVIGSGFGAQHTDKCRYYMDGAYHVVATGAECRIQMAEEDGWAIIYGQGLLETEEGGWDQLGVVVPPLYHILDPEGRARPLAHVNSSGQSVAGVGIVGFPDGKRLDLRGHFEGFIRLGAIDDDGRILAQLDDEVVLLTPR